MIYIGSGGFVKSAIQQTCPDCGAFGIHEEIEAYACRRYWECSSCGVIFGTPDDRFLSPVNVLTFVAVVCVYMPFMLVLKGCAS